MAIGFLAWRPLALHAAYSSDVALALQSTAPALPSIGEAHLTHLPDPVRRYLRSTGVVGEPPVANFRVRLHGRIRSDADSRWMPLRAQQYTFVRERKRFFYLTSSMFGVPVQGYHRYADGMASLDVRAARLIPIVSLTGPEMFQSETVTFLNDMCLFAPATLIDPAFVWKDIDVRTVGVRFTNAGVTVGAELTFNDKGELVDFVSDDRYQASTDGKRATRRRWSTPVTSYRLSGPKHLVAAGEGRWHTPEGSFAYIELEVDDVACNVRTRHWPR